MGILDLVVILGIVGGLFAGYRYLDAVSDWTPEKPGSVDEYSSASEQRLADAANRRPLWLDTASAHSVVAWMACGGNRWDYVAAFIVLGGLVASAVGPNGEYLAEVPYGLVFAVTYLVETPSRHRSFAKGVGIWIRSSFAGAFVGVPVILIWYEVSWHWASYNGPVWADDRATMSAVMAVFSSFLLRWYLFLRASQFRAAADDRLTGG